MHRLKLASTALVAFTTCSAFAKDNLSIGIVTFSASDIHTNQMVDTMASEAKSKGWTVESLNANGDPSQAIAQIKQLVTKKADAIIVTVFELDGPCRRTASCHGRQGARSDCGGRNGARNRACRFDRRGSAIGRPYVEESWRLGDRARP